MSANSITWGEGWASEYGGAPAPGATPKNGTERMGIALRALIAAATGLPTSAVRPANQSAPASKPKEEFATVEITASQDMGQHEQRLERQLDGSFLDYVNVLREITVSVNFYRGPHRVDAAGNPVYSVGAYDRALRLEARLGLSQFVELARSYRIGFLRASRARDLAAIDSAQWESRGQVDLYFSVVAQENAPVSTFAGIGPITITVDNPAGNQSTKTIP